MSVEGRLVDALHEADSYQASPDLFARLERSIAEDRAFRKRRLKLAALLVGSTALLTLWFVMSTTNDDAGELAIDSWRVLVAYLAVSIGVLIALAPHIRRFGRSFVDDVFHLSPNTGGRFLAVLDVAYYAAFAGLILVDADAWEVVGQVELLPTLESAAGRLGFLLAAMGVLHAVNIAFLPVLGIVFNSIVRMDLRRRAGDAAPPESMRARTVDANAKAFALGVLVLVLAIVGSLLFGPIGGWITGLLS